MEEQEKAKESADSHVEEDVSVDKSVEENQEESSDSDSEDNSDNTEESSDSVDNEEQSNETVSNEDEESTDDSNENSDSSENLEQSKPGLNENETETGQESENEENSDTVNNENNNSTDENENSENQEIENNTENNENQNNTINENENSENEEAENNEQNPDEENENIQSINDESYGNENNETNADENQEIQNDKLESEDTNSNNNQETSTENNSENQNTEESISEIESETASGQQVLINASPKQIERNEDGKIKGTRINKMVMNGFKSFAKHTEFLFDGDYNCVIGPNGSGKSNVLDALCFVLGKSSAKSLRAEKSANLIYNGGKAKKPAKQGEVSIFFDNKDKTFPTADSEVKITRIVRQNGQSIYKINDETRTRQEILDLMAIARINPDAYNIILQGDIVKLVEMRPDDRRELIGEIAGITVYEEKKNKAVRELEKVDERLKETEIVLTERNTYLKELRKDRDQAMKYKGMSDQIKVNQASYLKRQIDRKSKEKEDMQKHMDSAKADLDKINEKIATYKKENEEKRAEINEITREIETKGEIEQVKLNKDVEAMKIELTKKHARIEQLKTETGKLEHRKKDLKEGIADIEEKVKQIDAEKKTMQDEITKKTSERNEIKAKIQKFKEKNNLDNLGDIEQQISEIDKKAEDLQKEAQENREKQHDLIREKDKISHELGSIDQQMEKVLAIESENKKQIDQLNKQREEFRKCTSDLTKKLEEDSINAAKLSEKRKKIVIVGEDLSKLRARQVSARELSYADVAIKRIVDLKKNNPKIYGTVAELGKVHSKYTLALEIAAGNKIKSVVVEDDKTAADCIKYLKDKKLGVVTFLPLNKIKGKKSDKSKIAKENGVEGLAIDLVTFDSKFKAVFEYVFGDSVVVDTIDVARRLGVGTAKYVTLDGDMANRAGAMHGGYRQKRKQSLGFSESDISDEIDKKEVESADLKSAIDMLEKRRIEDEDIISRLRTTKAQLEGEIIKSEKSLHLDRGDLDASKEKKELLQKEDEAVDERIRLVQEKVSTLNSELAVVKTEKEKLRQSIAQLRNPTLIAELNAFEEKMQQLNEDMIKIDSEIKVRDTQAAAVYRGELEKTHKIIKEIDKDQEQFSEELQNLEETVKAQEKDLSEKESKAQEFYSQFKGLFHKRSEIDKAIQENDSKISTQVEKSRGFEIKVNTYTLKLSDVNASLAGLEQEFSEYEGVELDVEKTEEQLKNEIRKFEKMRDQIGSVNMRALEIYEDVEKQYNSLLEKKESLDEEKNAVMKMMEEIEGRKRELFLRTFTEVNGRFQEFFTKLTSKGAKAALVIENEDDPFDAGVRINVKITGSKFLDIRSLSGGEKTMTALAFIFAIQEYEPASFYVLDEVDAALDKHNSEKLAKLIGEYSDNAQYVVISHNDAVISEADILYGISMNEHGMSQVVSLKV